ncbi:MAG: thiol:disulfide interchange protein DsbA/DsbL [Pseudomonadota bacterium]
MKLIRQIFIVLALLCAAQAYAAPQAGKDYTVLNPPQPTRTGNKIEVIEFFFYGCSHCFKLHPLINAWEQKAPKDVELVFVPAIFNPSWEPMARTFYALEALGQRKQLHDALFQAWNKNIELIDEASATDFVAKNGVDRKKFSDAYNSFSMQSKITRARQMAQMYGIRGTPTLIVDGKYLISGLHPEETMQVLNFLVDKARAEKH